MTAPIRSAGNARPWEYRPSADRLAMRRMFMAGCSPSKRRPDRAADMTDFRFFHGLAWGLFFSAVLWLIGGLSVWAAFGGLMIGVR